MPCFIISYDLKGGKSEEYSALYDAIKAYGTWAQITESTWAVVTDSEIKEVRDDLMQNLKDGDRLFVVKSGVAGAWRNVKCSNAWLRNHL